MKFAKAMKGDGGAESTKDTGFKKGSSKGIPASTMHGAVGMSGKKATFKAGKKTVKK
jgi:hypothetical protein